MSTENIDSTMRPANLDDFKDGTIRPAMNNMEGTMRVAGVEATVRTAGNPKQQQHEEVNDNSFVLKGERYRNVQVLSDNSGEAQVFLVENDGKEYVLKVYYPNFDVNKKILQTVLNFNFEMIVKVFDYGKTYVDGKHRYYELMEYLRGGTMADYKLNGDMDTFRRIALQGAAALAYCHEFNLLHKNLY